MSSTDSAEKPKREVVAPPLQLDVHRGLLARDVIWHDHKVWVCVNVNDCSAKLVQVNGDWTQAQVQEVASGIRVSPSTMVGDPTGAAAYKPRNTALMWLVGRLPNGQVVRHDPGVPISRERTSLGVVELPLPGFAPSAKRRRRPPAEPATPAVAEPALAEPALAPAAPPEAPAGLAPEMSWLLALEKASSQVAAIVCPPGGLAPDASAPA